MDFTDDDSWAMPTKLESERDMHFNKMNDAVYLSKAFPNPTPPELVGRDPGSNMQRFVSKVVDGEGEMHHVSLTSEVVLRCTQKTRQEVKACYYEDDRGITSLVIQKFNKHGKPLKTQFSFKGDEIGKLHAFLLNIPLLPSPDGKDKLSALWLEDQSIDQSNIAKLINDNPGLLQAIIDQGLTSADMMSLAYKKRTLEIFRLLMTDEIYFAEHKAQSGIKRPEDVWQQFFEENTWIFGFGLQYVFGDSLPDKKLEQITTGNYFNGPGKRIDALLRTRGIIRSVALAEIKRHDERLLKKGDYRPGCYVESKDLAGGISQIRMTTELLLNKVSQTIHLIAKDGSATMDTIYTTKPKAFLIIGRLSEFQNEHGPHLGKLAAFERYRNSIPDIEVITYDELYERAKGIVENIVDAID